MARWPRIGSTAEDMAAEADVLRTVPTLNGTVVMLPNDAVEIGKGAFVEIAERAGMKTLSRIYAAIDKMCEQPFMVKVGSAQLPATMTSSATAWFMFARHDFARQLRHAQDWSAYGKLGGRPRK